MAEEIDCITLKRVEVGAVIYPPNTKISLSERLFRKLVKQEAVQSIAEALVSGQTGPIATAHAAVPNRRTRKRR